jgi:SepF-like predicted cell division protein (DUF552 family)
LKTRIECKWQQTAGSVDEKLPYLYLNTIEAMPEDQIMIIIDGAGWKKGAVDWLRRAVNEKKYTTQINNHKKIRNIYKYMLYSFNMVFDKIRKALSGSDISDDEYVEIDLEQREKDNKVLVKLFVLKQYEDVTEILNCLREGYTIAIVDIRTLRQKDPIELKRAVSKVKKTVDALEGNIAGFGENILIATPSFARIHKEVFVPHKDEMKRSRFD